MPQTPTLERLLKARCHRVRALMAERGHSEEDVAEATGLKKRTVQRVLRGQHSSDKLLQHLERTLGKDFRAIWYETGAAA